MRVLARDAEIALWKVRIEWLQSARELLERLLEESRRPQVQRAVAATDRRSASERMGRLRVL
jgi:hypothetical protein